jgi:CRP-like cAMP-binding protein
MLSMVNCHSKSRMPVDTLNDTEKLRKTMQERVEADLHKLYHRQMVEKASQALLRAQREGDPATSDRLSGSLRQAEDALRMVQAANLLRDAPSGRVGRHYDDFRRDSFRWLVSTHEGARALVGDVIDTLRALRCADALRQRGTVLKTSGGYEVFVDRETANAIYALHMGEDQMFLLEVLDAVAAGEANLASSQIDPSGNLRVSFHRGAFPDPETTRQAAHNLALVIDGIQGDTVESFQRRTPLGVSKAAQSMEILLEGADDNLAFAALVRRDLERINPEAAARTRCVPSMQNASDVELARYLQAEALDWDLDTRRQALQRIARSGHRTGDVDPVDGFEDVRLARLKNDEILIEAGAPSGFVYIPLGEGLQAAPLGGYATSAARPWMPLGATGVIRGAARNSTVTAERDVALLMIPKEVYLRAWHRTYGVDELTQVLAQRQAALEGEEVTLTSLEKRLILQTVGLFAEIPARALAELVPIVSEVRREAGEVVLEKGDPGDNMYVIVEGQVRVHDGAHTLNYLGQGDVFGEMTLLDPEPRMATVTAVVDTHLLRLHRHPFHSLMAGHPEMAQGIIRVLLRRLRAQARDVTDLRARVQQLKG